MRDLRGTSVRDQLVARMVGPQRHRLLQGFPAVPAMGLAVPADVDVEHPSGLVRRPDGALEDSRFDEAVAELRLGGPKPVRGDVHPDDRAALDEEPAQAELLWRRREAWLGAVVAGGKVAEAPWVDIDRGRDLIVGVIPHTGCAPRIDACGFCTFPHDRSNKPLRRDMINAVARDIGAVASHPALHGRRVHAVYFGGGTSNLASPEELDGLVQALRQHFVLDGAELTVEGVPSLFDGWFSSHLRTLSKQAVAHRRISMGVQTFDPRFLALMGRERFGDAALVKRLVLRCRALEITTSADFLFNLPGQTLAQMEHDVDLAVAAGLEQICLYHLVLYEGLGTPWSKDPGLVRSVPDNHRAAENWLVLRERLLRAGYVQSTLTNFERSDVGSGPKRFRYETASFAPDRTDAIGFGPLSLSTFVDWPNKRGLKLLRRKYLGPPAWSCGDLAFRYDEASLRLLFLTRCLATTRVDFGRYAAVFGTSLWDDFAESLTDVEAEGLLARDQAGISLTPLGMFYADAVVSTLAQATSRGRGAGVRTADLMKETPRPDLYEGMG